MTFVEDSYRRLHPQLWRCLLVYCGDGDMASDVESTVYREALDEGRLHHDGLETSETRIWRAALSYADETLTDDGFRIGCGDNEFRAVVERRTLSNPELLRPHHQLSETQRRIVILRYVGDLEVDDIAEIMAMTPSVIQAELRQLDPIPNQVLTVDPPDFLIHIARQPEAGWIAAARRSGAASLVALATVALVVMLLARPAGEIAEIAGPNLQPDSERSQVAPEPDEWVDLPAGFSSTAVKLSATDPDVAIFDLRVVTGERFRLTVPRRFESELEQATTTGIPRSIVLSGKGSTEIHVDFRRCRNQDLMATNSRGSHVYQPNRGTVALCRPDELLLSTVSTGIALDDSDLDLFDLRPIDVGTAYRNHIARVMGRAVCPECAPFGPAQYSDVVVNRTGDGSISAVSFDNLSRQWTIDQMGDDVMLLDAHPASSQRSERDGIWIAAPGRAVTMVEAATGDPRWELKLDDGETRFELFDMGNEPWILASSYEGAGDNRPPRLRRIDPVSGLVIWSVEGRPGAVWALDGVAFDDTTLFTVDVFDDPQSAVSPSGSVVHAFSLDRGRSMFAVDIEAPQGAFTTRRLMHMLTKGPDMALLASTAHGLLVRLDPRTGEQFWSTRINPGKPDHLVQSIDGNLAVYVTTSLNDFLYDLETGHRLVDSTYR